MRTFHLGLGLMMTVLIVSTCGPAATPTPIPTPMPVLATRIEDIVGTWEGIGFDGLIQRLYADGTCEIGITLDRLAVKPDIECTFRFEGTRFILTEVEATGLTPCQAGAKTGIYEVQLLANGNIQFKVVQDLCGRRRRSMILEHRPVR